MAAIVARNPGYIMKMFDTENIDATEVGVTLYDASDVKSQVKLPREHARDFIDQEALDADYRFNRGWWVPCPCDSGVCCIDKL